MKNTSAKLTNLLKLAQKTNWYGTDHLGVTFGFVYQHPAYVDWKYTGNKARALYETIMDTIDTMCIESYGTNAFTSFSIFTAYQARVLEL